MIRPYQPSDLDALMEIWLSSNLEAHGFIPAAYWQENAPAVRGMLPQSELLVCDNGGGPLGFLGLQDREILGIFVRCTARSQGVGHALIEAAKARRSELRLHVYRENHRARRFYEREGFRLFCEGTDPDTGAAELTLRWACR